MWLKKLAGLCLLFTLALVACESSAGQSPAVPTSVSAPTESIAPTQRVSGSTVTLVIPTPITPTPLPRLRSGEQPVWTNTGDEADTLLVTLQSSRGQVEEGESTLITASANNMSGSPLDVSLIIQLGAGLMVSSSTGCSGRVQATSPL